MKTLATDDRTGALIVRIWIEADHGTALRARITQTLDSSTAERPVAVASSAEDICTVVKEWVEAFTTASDDRVTRR